MKMCVPHWEQLKDAIRERDLFRFVSNDGAGVAEKLRAQLQPGEPVVAGFDPLLNANFAIWGNAMDGGGLYLMTTKEDGTEYCPLCEVEANTPVKAATWIGYAADEQLERARKLGLMPKATPQ